MGINCDPSKVVSWASSLGFEVSQSPCSYLGLALGGSLMSVLFWDLVLLKVKKRLSSWEKGFPL